MEKCMRTTITLYLICKFVMRHEKFIWMQWLFYVHTTMHRIENCMDMICLYFALHFACAQVEISSIRRRRRALPHAHSHVYWKRYCHSHFNTHSYTTMANEMNAKITCLVYNLIHYTIEYIYLYVNSCAAIKMIMDKGNFSLAFFPSFHFSNVRMLEDQKTW